MSKQSGSAQMSKQTGQGPQGNKGGWPSTTGNPSGGNRSSNPAPAPAPAPINPSSGSKGNGGGSTGKGGKK